MARNRDGKEVKIRKSIRVEPRIVSFLEKKFGSFSAGINEILKKSDLNMIGPGLADTLRSMIEAERRSFRSRWGCELGSDASQAMGGDEFNGGEIFNDELTTSSRIQAYQFILKEIEK